MGPIVGALAPGTGGGTFGNPSLRPRGEQQRAGGLHSWGRERKPPARGCSCSSQRTPTQPAQTLALKGEQIGQQFQQPIIGDTFATFGPPLNNDTGTVGVHANLTSGGGNDEGLYLFFAADGTQPECRAINRRQ